MCIRDSSKDLLGKDVDVHAKFYENWLVQKLNKRIDVYTPKLGTIIVGHIKEEGHERFAWTSSCTYGCEKVSSSLALQHDVSPGFQNQSTPNVSTFAQLFGGGGIMIILNIWCTVTFLKN